LEKARYSRFPAVALAAWEELFRHGRVRAFPTGAAGKPLAAYREIAAFAAKPRYWEVVTVRGTFTVALDTEEAPITTYNLCQLAEKKFFDNLTFHRVVSNFVVQGGDPRGDGWGGPGFFLPDELSRKPFAAGSVGMALAGPDTGGSQFFVALTDQPHLTGRYPRVGTVASGFEVVRRLQMGDRILRIRCGEGHLRLPSRFGTARLRWKSWSGKSLSFAKTAKATSPTANGFPGCARPHRNTTWWWPWEPGVRIPGNRSPSF
jgi:cyclophilin family peptidyl-prolyl cis-trans isomerase